MPDRLFDLSEDTQLIMWNKRAKNSSFLADSQVFVMEDFV